MANDVGRSGYKYGSVNNDEESGATTDSKSFDESNLYFMKDEDLSKKEKGVKVFKLAVPIIIAVLLIGGLAFLMFHNFAHFYPGRGGNKHSHSMSSGATPWPNDDDGTSGASISAPWSKDDDSASGFSIPAPSTSTSGGSSCSANPKCVDLGLTGQCCPSGSGVQLSCCS